MEDGKTVVPKSTQSAKKGIPGGLNIWQIISIVLAVVVGALLLRGTGTGGGDDIEPQAAADQFIAFVSKVYKPQIGEPVFREIVEESGLYKITMGVVLPSGPTDQVIYLTKDGKFFTAQETLLDIQDIESQFDLAVQQQGNLPPADVGQDPNIQLPDENTEEPIEEDDGSSVESADADTEAIDL